VNTMSETGQPSQVPIRSDKEALELQHLQVEVEKLRLEVEALRSSTFWDRIVGRYLPLVTAVLAVAGFWVGMIQFLRQQTDTESQRADAVQQRSEELRREAAKPFWDSQLQIYLRASEAAAIIATSSDQEAVSRAEGQFWVLYWGPLAIVEDVGTATRPVAEVEHAMVQFGRCIRTNPKERNREEMHRLSLDLAHAMRKSVGPSFDLKPTELAGARMK
jgi:hypothetical protein